jgi:hypothetical protein
MPSAWASIKLAGIVAPVALSCVMHQSVAAGVAEAEADRRGQEMHRLAISARSQMMSFARATWLRERGSPRGDASLWQLWESDWTAIRRTSVAQLPAWCRDVTADVTAAESREYAITFLHSHATPESLRDVSPAESSPPIRLDVAMQPSTSPSTPAMASPSLAIQRTIADTPAIAVASNAQSRLSHTSMLEEQSDQPASEVISGARAGLFK